MNQEDISTSIWKDKYRYGSEATIAETHLRVVNGVYAKDPERETYAPLAVKAMEDWLWCPGGRIHAGAGTPKRVTLINCYVAPTMEDSMVSIMQTLNVVAFTQQQGGGIGTDFSTLRPRGALVRRTGSVSSGILPFMDAWHSVCSTIKSSGSRRGAMMGVLACWHPDLPAFITAKQEKGRLTNFNVSVLITDPFMKAVEQDLEWNLGFNVPPQDTSKIVASLPSHHGDNPTNKSWWKRLTGQDPSEWFVYDRLPARKLWDMILRNTYDWAEPGVIFIDRINEQNNLGYAEHIHATNPCVTASMRLHTGNGIIKVGSLFASQEQVSVTVDKRALLTGKYGVSTRPATPVFMTSEDAPVFRVVSQDGYELTATNWHDFYTQRGKIKLKDLRVGDEILVQSGKGQFGREGNLSLGRLLGLIAGDGHFTGRGKGKTAVVIGLWGEDRHLSNSLSETINKLISMPASNNRVYSVSPVPVPLRNMEIIRSVILASELAHYGFTAKTKLQVPDVVWRGSEDCVRGYLQGLFNADGTVNVSWKSNSCSIRLSSSKRSLLVEVQVLLANFGIFSRLKQRRKAGMRELPDGRGSSKKYHCKVNFELIIDGESREWFMSEIGFLTETKNDKYLSWVGGKKLKKTQPFRTKIKSIKYIGHEAVYDLTQEDHNSVIFNGLVTGQCGEQPLPPNGDCNLGAVNLAKIVRDPFGEPSVDFSALEQTTVIGMRFLDNVLDVSLFPLEEQRIEAQNKRRTGMGILGLANLLQQMKIRYGSPEAIELTKEVMRRQRDAAYWASVNLAKERGPFPLFEKDSFLSAPYIKRLPADLRDAIAEHGIRNGVIQTIAPTGTTSIYYQNVSSGLEPTFSWKHFRKVLQPDNSFAEFPVEDYGYRVYKESGGSTEKLPPYMVTALELTVDEHLDMQAACQEFVDASISKTINCPSDMPYDKFKAVYSKAYEIGLKGCTTYRPSGVRGAVLTTESQNKPNIPVIVARPQKLIGATYKVRWPKIDSAFYVTINDHIGEDGIRRPFEIFINSKSVQHTEWIAALTRCISAIFRRGLDGGDITFIVDELIQVFSATGGAFMNGGYVPSLVALIGQTIGEHMKEIGLIARTPTQYPEGSADGSRPSITAMGDICPLCNQPTLFKQEGCEKCSCGYSSCG